MSKKLKICLAMGGGVSLGTFSGAALTEALKLLVLYGQDKEGNVYEKVEVDGMSGASAGSIALAIMMRCLIDYKSLLPILLDKTLTNNETLTESQLENRVSQYYNIQKGEPKFETIKCLEVAQIIQKLIWVNTLDTKKLFDISEKTKFGEPFGILSRSKAIDAARKILLEGVENINVDNKLLVSDQALMAFTMANLSPIAYGEKSASSGSGHSLVDILQTSTDIKNHNEVRIFDLHLKPTSDVDDRFLTIPTSESSPIQKKRSFQDKDTWAEILASAVASGAFPIGFPPAIVTKYRDEYYENEWAKNSSITHLNFAYVDGGTFNNEPIKEAFKLGNYRDFVAFKPDLRDFEDRLILFVDPSVPGDAPVRQLKSLDPLNEIKNFEFTDKQSTTSMIDVTLDLLKTVVSQSEINEESKIKDFYQNSILKNSLFKYFKELESLDLKTVLETTFIITTYKSIYISIKSRQISIGTRDLETYFFWHYTKICYLRKQKNMCLTKDTFEKIYKLISDYVNKSGNLDDLLKEINKIITNVGCTPEEESVNLGAAIFLAISELGLNQFGKDSTAERAGIFPIQGSSGKFKIEKLPGHEIAGFAGFASFDARKACFAKGRLDALRSLQENDFRVFHYNTMLKENHTHIEAYVKTEDHILSMQNTFESEFKEEFSAWENSFALDIEKNMRQKIVDRIVNIVSSLRSQNKIPFLTSLGILWNLIFDKKDLIYKLTDRELISPQRMMNLAFKTKNIAIKFRFKGDVKSILFDTLNAKDIGVKGHTFEDDDMYTYFKCYLVMVPKLINDENKVTQYAYLSLSQLTENSHLRKLHTINANTDTNKIMQIKSTNSNGTSDFHFESLEILKFIEDNYQLLKLHINPVIEISSNTLSVHDLCEPLAKVINPGWKPFI